MSNENEHEFLGNPVHGGPDGDTQVAVMPPVNAPAAVLTKNDPNYLMAQFEAGNNTAFYTSLKPDGTRETAIKIYNAISDTEQLRDHVNEVLNIVNVMAHPLELLDEESGEITTAIRTILIDEDGTAYAAVSEGVRSSITRLVQICGQAPWEQPLRLTAVEKSTRSNAMFRVLTLRLLADGEEPGKKKK